jgi:hypothetical protein
MLQSLAELFLAVGSSRPAKVRNIAAREDSLDNKLRVLILIERFRIAISKKRSLFERFHRTIVPFDFAKNPEPNPERQESGKSRTDRFF